ncbi:MAG: carboxymuconolactone decarboxylase family protein [Methanospirillaceae archaeon]|nr:carboxymuconolactone decarboxylase family protein [Methanospirillaceae archaeon]
MERERFTRGMHALRTIQKEAGDEVYRRLSEISPDFADMLVTYPFGDIYTRSGLDLRSREIATISALTVLGYATPQLSAHIRAGLNAGLSQDEIIEIIIQMSVYAGFPAAINAMYAAKTVFDKDETEPVPQQGSPDPMP